MSSCVEVQNANVWHGTADSITATTDTTLVAATTGRRYSIVSVVFTIFGGTVAPTAGTTIKLYSGTSGGTVLLNIPTPDVVDVVVHYPFYFGLAPIWAATSAAITAKLSAALGASGTWSLVVTGTYRNG